MESTINVKSSTNVKCNIYKVRIPSSLSLKKNVRGGRLSINNRRRTLSRRSDCCQIDIFERSINKSNHTLAESTEKKRISKTIKQDDTVISLSSDDEAARGVVDILNEIYGDGWKTPVTLKNPTIKKGLSVKKALAEKKKLKNGDLSDKFDNSKNKVHEAAEIYGDGWKTPVTLKNPTIKKNLSVKKALAEKKKLKNGDLSDKFDNSKNKVHEAAEIYGDEWKTPVTLKNPTIKKSLSVKKAVAEKKELKKGGLPDKFDNSKNKVHEAAAVVDILNKVYGEGWKTPVTLNDSIIKKGLIVKKSVSEKKVAKAIDLTGNFDSFQKNVREDFESTRRPIIKSDGCAKYNFKNVKTSVKVVSCDSDSDSDSVCILENNSPFKALKVGDIRNNTPSKQRDSFINDSSSDYMSSDSKDDCFKNSPAFYNKIDNNIRKQTLLKALHSGNIKNKLESRYDDIKKDSDSSDDDLENSFSRLNIVKPKNSLPVFKTPVEIKRLSFLASLSENIPEGKSNLEALKFHKNFNKTKELLALNLFRMFNKEVFKNKLPSDMPIVWTKTLRTTAGTCRCSTRLQNGEKIRKCSINLCLKALDRPSRVRDTLIHELCHAACFLIDLKNDGHGKLWKSWTAKAMRAFSELPYIGTTHNYTIEKKFAYICEGCGYVITRHSKSLDINKKCCGKCRGKFIVHRKNKNGELDLVKSFSKVCQTPRSFPLFVKNNYGKVKTPNLKHVEVMQKLSEMFKKEMPK